MQRPIVGTQRGHQTKWAAQFAVAEAESDLAVEWPEPEAESAAGGPQAADGPLAAGEPLAARELQDVGFVHDAPPIAGEPGLGDLSAGPEGPRIEAPALAPVEPEPAAAAAAGVTAGALVAAALIAQLAIAAGHSLFFAGWSESSHAAVVRVKECLFVDAGATAGDGLIALAADEIQTFLGRGRG